jgi:hypothetical protein
MVFAHRTPQATAKVTEIQCKKNDNCSVYAFVEHERPNFCKSDNESQGVYFTAWLGNDP